MKSAFGALLFMLRYRSDVVHVVDPNIAGHKVFNVIDGYGYTKILSCS